MPSVFDLFGDLRADTGQFEGALRSSEARLRATESAISSTEQRARGLGQTSAAVARSYERLNERIGEQRAKLQQAASAFTRGEATSKQMASALSQVDRAAAGVNSRLKDSSARLTDFAAKQSFSISKLSTMGQHFSQLGQSLSIGITAPLIAASYAFVRSATSIDAMRNRLIAATGSIASANTKMAELRQLAQANAGVFTQGAVEMYAFLKPLQVGDKTINTMIKAMGRLKLANEEMDLKRMALNMTQLFTQAFERTDLKEAVGNFPRFGEILQKAFQLSGSDLDTVASEMKNKLAAGLSREQFFSAIADAIQNDPSLSKLSDTVGIRFQKMMERVFVAIEPLGNAILSILEPIAAAVTPVIERVAAAFAGLSPVAQTIVLAFAGIAAAIGPMLVVIGSLVSAITAIVGAASTLGIVALVIAGLPVAMAPVIAQAAVWYAAWQTNFGGIRDLVSTVAQAIQGAWGQMSQQVSDLTKQVTAEIAQFWAENGEDIKKAVTTVSNFIKQIWQQVAAFWAANQDSIKQITADAWSAVRATVLGAIRIITATIKLIAAVINGDWANAWAATKTIVATALGAVTVVLLGAGKVFLNAIKVALLGVFNLGTWIQVQAIKLGIALVQGFASGIRSGASSVITAAQGIATSAIGAAKERLGIQSPSKVFFAIGKDTAQGFIDGLAAMKASAQSAMAGLLDVTGIKSLSKKNDAEGIGLLSSLISEIAKFNIVTKEQEIRLELTAGKYAKLNKEVRERILLAAQESDRLKAVLEAQELYREILDKMGPANEKSMAEVVAEKLKTEAWKGLNETMRERLKLLSRFADFAARKELNEGATDPNATRSTDGLGGGGGLGGLPTNETPQQIEENIPDPPRTSWDQFWTMMKIRLDEFKNSLPSVKEALGENLIGALEGISSSLANNLTRWSGSFKETFRNIVSSFAQMAQQIATEMIRLIILKSLLKLFGGAIGGTSAGGGGAADGGSHSSPGGMASGGLVRGPGTGTSDSIFARLSNNEYVVKAKAVAHYGAGLFDRLNNLQMPNLAFAGGGLVGGGSSMSSIYNNSSAFSPTINVYMPPSSGSGGNGGGGATKDQIERAVMSALYKSQLRNK